LSLKGDGKACLVTAEEFELGTKETSLQAQALDSCNLAGSETAIHVASYVLNPTIATSGARIVSRAKIK
jgi:hypothetical protein